MEKVNSRTTAKNPGCASKILYFLLGLILIRPSLDYFAGLDIQIHQSLPHFNLNMVIGGLVFIITTAYLLFSFKSLFKIRLFWPIIIFLAVLGASIFYSLDTGSSIKEFIRVASIFLLYLTAYLVVTTKQEFKLLFKTILLSYVIPGLFAIGQLVMGKGLADNFGGFNRIFGTFAHPNLFAFYTLFILGLSLSLLLSLRYGKRFLTDKHLTQNNLIIYCGLLLVLLFFTYTRSALAGLIIYVFIVGIFKYRKLILIALLLLTLTYFVSDVFQERVLDIIALDPYGSIIWRFRLWADALDVAFYPIYGYGIGTFNNIVEYYRGFSFGSSDAHNDYLKIFIENGLIGLMAYAWLILTLVFSMLKIHLKKRNVFSLGILAIAASMFIASSFDNILRTTALQWSFWIFAASWLKINSPLLLRSPTT